MRNHGETIAMCMGISFTDLEASIRRVSSWTEEQIEKTLEQANKELPNHFLIIKELSTKIFNDSDSCERANLNYVNPNYKLIKTGITHYLLSNANQNAT